MLQTKTISADQTATDDIHVVITGKRVSSAYNLSAYALALGNRKVVWATMKTRRSYYLFKHLFNCPPNLATFSAAKLCFVITETLID